VKDIPPDLTGTFELRVEEKHTAAAYGNAGMLVLATPIVVWMVEVAAYQAIQPYLDAGEGVAGTHIDLRHLAPTAIGRPVVAHARLTERRGRRSTFACRVLSGDTLIAEGTYEHAIIDQARILASAESDGQ
jgi:fluoroacetyl-CoA thioesterase